MEIRKLWLKKPDTGAVWDLLPANPRSVTGGCFLSAPSGLGYKQTVTQKQVGVDFTVDKIVSAAGEINGSLYFYGTSHLENFQAFVGDFSSTLILCYSPDGTASPQSGTPWYKKVTVTAVDKGETDGSGWYVCKISILPLSSVWKKDYTHSVTVTSQISGNALVYPWVYPYVFGSRNTLALEITNGGRETGCTVSIKNTSATPLANPEYVAEHSYDDAYGATVTEYQRAKFYAALQQAETLRVDSNATTQSALVLGAGSSENVVDLQEPSWEYINFVRLQNGANRLVFYVDDITAEITVTYSEQRELV